MKHETQESIAQWARDTFGPNGSWSRTAARANEEMAELLAELTSPNFDATKAGQEIADVIIVLCQLADRMNVDIQREVDIKMAKNRARKWRLDGSGQGYHE